MATGRSSRVSNSCARFSKAELAELTAIAERYVKASGLLMKIMELAGSATGAAIAKLPADWQDKLRVVTEAALRRAYDVAASTAGTTKRGDWTDGILKWANGEQWHRIASVVTGAIGGSGGVPTAIAELPVTVTLILRSIQEIARAHGEDPSRPEVRRQCILVFSLGGPLTGDDQGDAGFWAARLAITDKAVFRLIRTVAARFGVVVSEKLIAEAAPLLGAAGGAIVNYTFTDYYQTMAHVHFRLRALERRHDRDQVRSCFESIVTGLHDVRATTRPLKLGQRGPRQAAARR